MTQNPKETKVIIASILLIGVVIAISILAILLAISIWMISTKNFTWDISNWVTMLIEIGTGIGIAVMILVYERNQQHKFQLQQDKISELIEETRKITSELERKNIENAKYQKEQKEFAIHRARSYLSVLHSIITVIVDVGVDPNYPPEHQTKFYTYYQQKNEIVRQLEYIVNQSDSVLEQSFLQRITDVIELARINPNVIDEDYGYSLDTSHCVGIKSQIDELLKIIPNPEI